MVGALGCVLAVAVTGGCTASTQAADAGSTPSTSPSTTAARSTPTPTTASPAPATSSGSADAPRGLPAVPGIVKQLQPSVVTIRTKIGLGSGVVYKSNGVIVTDAHVVENEQHQPFEHVQVSFADGQKVGAKVLAVDNVTDVAVIKADRTGLPVPKFATGLPQVGEMCVVIGSPLGLAETATAGIVSGLHRTMPPSDESPQGLFNLIQTDAPISPGNSGGPVANGNGVVIGLSEAYIPPSEGAVAIGFVTPATIVTDIADQLLASGKAKHAFLGVQPSNISSQMVQLYGLPRSGALVLQVVPHSPAAQAGLQRGDVIVKLDGDKVGNVTDLLRVLREAQPGEQVPVEVDRNGQAKTLHVRLTSRP